MSELRPSDSGVPSGQSYPREMVVVLVAAAASVPPDRAEHVVAELELRGLLNLTTKKGRIMDAYAELVDAIEGLRGRVCEVATGLSHAFEATGDDTDGLLIDEAGNIVYRLDEQLRDAKHRVATFVGLKHLAQALDG